MFIRGSSSLPICIYSEVGCLSITKSVKGKEAIILLAFSYLLTIYYLLFTILFMDNKVILNDSNPSSPTADSGNQILVTPIGSPNNEIPEAVLQPVRPRTVANLGPITRLNVQRGPYNFINLTRAVEAKLDTMGLSGIAKLKKKQVLYKETIEEIDLEERLINREPTHEVQDTNDRDFELIFIALRDLQREINASAEETCGPPTKFQRSGSPSNDGGPGNSGASHMKASPPKMACLSLSASNKDHVMTTVQLPPIPVRNESSDVVALVVAGVGVTVAATLLYWIKVWSEKK